MSQSSQRSDQIWIVVAGVAGTLSFVGIHLLFVLSWHQPIATAYYLTGADEPLKAALTGGVLLVLAAILGYVRGRQASVLGSALLVGFVFVAFLYRFFLLPVGSDNAVVVDALLIVVPAGLIVFAGIYLGQWVRTRTR
jgi:hypothetical protein